VNFSGVSSVTTVVHMQWRVVLAAGVVMPAGQLPVGVLQEGWLPAWAGSSPMSVGSDLTSPSKTLDGLTLLVAQFRKF